MVETDVVEGPMEKSYLCKNCGSNAKDELMKGNWTI